MNPANGVTTLRDVARVGTVGLTLAGALALLASSESPGIASLVLLQRADDLLDDHVLCCVPSDYERLRGTVKRKHREIRRRQFGMLERLAHQTLQRILLHLLFF